MKDCLLTSQQRTWRLTQGPPPTLVHHLSTPSLGQPLAWDNNRLLAMVTWDHPHSTPDLGQLSPTLGMDPVDTPSPHGDLPPELLLASAICLLHR